MPPCIQSRKGFSGKFSRCRCKLRTSFVYKAVLPTLRVREEVRKLPSVTKHQWGSQAPTPETHVHSTSASLPLCWSRCSQPVKGSNAIMQIVYEKLPAPRKQMLLIPALGGRGGRISINPRPAWSKYKEIISQIFFIVYFACKNTGGPWSTDKRKHRLPHYGQPGILSSRSPSHSFISPLQPSKVNTVKGKISLK